jgi:hypothetical protein
VSSKAHLFTCALTLVLVIALFAFRDVPMVDLPQHAAQIAAWLNWHDPLYRTHELELNFRTPYLLAYPVARLFAPVVGVVFALKLVVAASVALHVVSFAHLVRRLGHDPWLSLLGVPTALGYAFYFGFVSFLIAMPVVYLAIAEAVRHAERPTLRSGLIVAGLLSLALLAHGIALGLALLAVVPLLVRGGGRFVERMLPLAAPVVFAAAWILPGTSTARIGDTIFDLRLNRALELAAMLVGIGPADGLATLTGLVVLVLAGCLVGAPSRRWERFLPLGLALVGTLTFPALFRGVGPLGPRFVVLLVPGLLLAFEARKAEPVPRRVPAAQAAMAFVAAAWVFLFVARLPAFNRETEGLHSLVGEMPAGKNIRPIVFERESEAFPGVPALLHLPAFYQVKKGGSQGYSFAMYPLSVVRYRAGVMPRMSGGAEWRPETFDWQREHQNYDYFVVHSSSDRFLSLFGGASDVVLEGRRGNWWAYRRGDTVAKTELSTSPPASTR